MWLTSKRPTTVMKKNKNIVEKCNNVNNCSDRLLPDNKGFIKRSITRSTLENIGS